MPKLVKYLFDGIVMALGSLGIGYGFAVLSAADLKGLIPLATGILMGCGGIYLFIKDSQGE